MKRTVGIMSMCLAFLINEVQAGVVTVSNYPLALLSNAVTAGTPSAEVLLSAGDVGHHGSLSPSKAKLIQDSDFVVWFGQELEQNLTTSLGDAPNAISLFRFDAFYRLPQRNIDGTPKVDSLDPHLWLDPQNAKAIVRALTVVHGYANPDNKAVFERNRDEFERQMDMAVAALPRHQGTRPYWAYHDAYQYLERSMDLTFAGALTPDHHLAPKASQFRLLNQARPAAQMCLLSQSTVSDGIKNKLGNVRVLIKQEDMSDGTTFIEAWQKMALDINGCVGS